MCATKFLANLNNPSNRNTEGRLKMQLNFPGWNFCGKFSHIAVQSVEIWTFLGLTGLIGELVSRICILVALLQKFLNLIFKLSVKRSVIYTLGSGTLTDPSVWRNSQKKDDRLQFSNSLYKKKIILIAKALTAPLHNRNWFMLTLQLDI